jgi:iron complex outermembrane recepter protein
MTKAITYKWNALLITAKAFLLILCLNNCAAAQTGSINGYITTSDGEPATGLLIAIEEIPAYTLTDDKGYFELNNLASKDYTIKIFAGDKLLQAEAVTITNGAMIRADFTIRHFSLHYLSEITINSSKNAYTTEKPSHSLRMEEKLIEIPQSITVINAGTIKDIGANTTDEILRTAAGILPVNNAGQDIQTMIRGTTSRNSILRNGIGSGYYFNMNPDAAMIDRVEFVKGPAGFMISNANPSGMINIVTKQPTHQKIRNVEIGYGSWNMMRATIDIGGEIKRESPLTYRLNAGIQHQDLPYCYGYFTKYFIAGAGQYEIKQNTAITFEYNFMRGKSLDGVRYLPSVNGQLYTVPYNVLISDPNASGIGSLDHYFKLTFLHKFNEHWSLNAHAGMVRGNWNANGLDIDIGRNGGAVSNDTIYRYAYIDDYNNRLYNAIAFLRGKYNIGKHLENHLLIGLDIGKTSIFETYYEQSERKSSLYYPAPAYFMPKSELQNFAADTYLIKPASNYEALYLQNRIKIHERFIVTLAMRYTLSHTTSWLDTTTVQTDKRLTPRMGFTYVLNNNFSLYTIMDEAFIPQTGKSFSGQQLKPLTGNNKEVGLKSFWFKKKLTVNVSAYRLVRNNALTIDPDHPNFQSATGQSVAKGIELDIIGQINKSISILANYAYTDSRVTESNKKAEIGLYTFNAPVHSIANLFIKYRFSNKTLKGLSLSAGMQYKDKFSCSRSQNAYLPGYTLFEAACGYVYKRWYFNFNIYNLTNTTYINFGSKYNETDWIYSPGMPVNFRLGIGFHLE